MLQRIPAEVLSAGRLYALTPAGQRALQSARSVPDRYRTILDRVQAGAGSKDIMATMAAHPAKDVLGWLDELETLGMVECVSPRADSPVDQAGDFAFNAVLARLRAA